MQGSGGGLPANAEVLGGNQMIAAAVSLSSSTDVAIDNSTGSLAITGAISGSGGLNLSGNGTLILSGSDSYSGGTFRDGRHAGSRVRIIAVRGNEFDHWSRHRLLSSLRPLPIRRPLPTRVPRSAAGQVWCLNLARRSCWPLLGLTLGLAGWPRSVNSHQQLVQFNEWKTPR